jgi:hypothetical protein
MVAWCDLQGPFVRWHEVQAMKLRKWLSSRAITRLCLVSPSQRSLYSSCASRPLPDGASESASEWLLARRMPSLPVLTNDREELLASMAVGLKSECDKQTTRNSCNNKSAIGLIMETGSDDGIINNTTRRNYNS